jgi:hypothetical protein
VADGFAMGEGNYSGTKTELEPPWPPAGSAVLGRPAAGELALIRRPILDMAMIGI